MLNESDSINEFDPFEFEKANMPACDSNLDCLENDHIETNDACDALVNESQPAYSKIDENGGVSTHEHESEDKVILTHSQEGNDFIFNDFVSI